MKNNNMGLEEKIINIFKYLNNSKNREGELFQVLEELGIEYINSDITEFRKYFENTDLIEIFLLPNRRMQLTLNQKGIDYLNSYEHIKAGELRDDEIKKMQHIELKSRIDTLERLIQEQSEFWTSSADRNKYQITYFWISIGIALLSLIISLLK